VASRITFIRMLSIAYHLDRVAVVVVQRFVEVVVDVFRKWRWKWEKISISIFKVCVCGFHCAKNLGAH